jgi:type II secretory pathway component PulJ
MQKKGFSAVELLVAVGLASLFTIFVFRLFTQSGSSQRKATSDLNMQSKVLTSQNRILKMIREGTDFIIPAIGEESPALIFCDNESNINALYQLEDKKLSEKTGKKIIQAYALQG